MSDDFSSHEEVTATKVNQSLRPGRLLAHGLRVTNSTSSASTTLVPVLRLDDIPVKSGRAVGIRTSALNFDTSVTNTVGQATITYTTDGSTPTISSTVLPGSVVKSNVVDTTHPEMVLIDTIYVPPADQTLSLLLCLSRAAGTGTIIMQADGTNIVIGLGIYDSGEYPGDTGTDL